MNLIILVCVSVPLILIFVAIVRRVFYHDAPLPRTLAVIVAVTIPVQYLLFLVPKLWQGRGDGQFMCDNIPVGLLYACSLGELLDNTLMSIILGNLFTAGLFFAVTAGSLYLLFTLFHRLWRRLRHAGAT